MKKLLVTFLCLIMVVVFMPTMASAETSGYVTVEITINPEYESTGRDADARIALANAEFDDEQFPTLKAAADAVHKLYSRAQDGTYTSTTYGYTNANPLYYTASGSDPQRPAERFPLSKVVYTVHGTVPSGDPANGINVTGSSDAMYAAVSDIQVVGVDNATITDCKGIYANVAGGYDATFVKNGTLLVKGINFTNTVGSTGITANGQANTAGSHADETNTIVEDCSFKNMLYTYLNDRSTTAPNYTIKNCTFDGSEAEKNYAIFIQPNNEDYVQIGKTVITGNTIANYKRAINIHDRPGATVEVSNNTISNIADEGGAAVQITRCDTITISNNTIDNIKYNVFRIHEIATAVNKITIKENKIKDSGYMFYVEKDAVSADKIVFSNNTVSNVDIANGYNKDADIGKEVVPHEIKAGVYGDLYEIDINFVDTLGQTTESKKVLYGTKLAEPSVSAKEGYIFAGWFADKDLKTKFDFTKEVTADTTLYAKWDVDPNFKPNTPEIVAPSVDTTKPVETVTVGVVATEATKDMIIESADADVQTKVEEALNAGKEVVTEVVAKKVDAANVEKADKAKVEAEIKGTGAVIAQYLDLGVLIKIQGEEDINIANLDEPLTFQIAVPKDLQKDGRVFTVIRVHDGKAEALKTVEKDGILTFQTDRFSTYALTYTDDTTPKTGDTNNLLPWMGLLALAGVAGTGVAMLKRKEN